MTDTFPAPTIQTTTAAKKPLWKKKKFFIPAGVLAGLIVIGVAAPAPEEQPQDATASTEVEIAAPAVTEAPVLTPAPTPTAVPVVTPAPAPAPLQAPITTVTPVEAPVAEAALMPNVVGMNLQAAQDLIQEQGVFLSLSEDATGRDRFQMLDRNWVVVGQNIEPGQPFGEGDAVLSVVKYSD